MKKKALGDIRVLDFGHVLAGPTAAMILADLGAEVLHIEPLQGDDARQFGPFVKGQSAYFMSINRNKKSIAIDLKMDKGKEIIEKLIADSDVLIENFRPDVMEKLGFSYERVKGINPRIIYASISGFGHDVLPDYRGKPSYDIIAQAYSGLMSITGTEDGQQVRVGSSIGDIMAGHQCAISILAALHHRKNTGEGQKIDQAMVDGLVYTLENAVVRYSVDGKSPVPIGTKHPSITPFQSFNTSDGQIVVPVGNDRLWGSFCRAIEKPDWVDDDRFKTNKLRTENRDELVSQLEPIFKMKKTGEWSDLLSASGVPNGPVNSVAQVVEDKNLKYREMIVDVDQPEVGRLTIAGSPFRLSETPGEVVSPAPLLGEHTEEILSALLGYSKDKIAELLKEKVVL
jgi:CoA:oxalate CoA-transferase